MKWLCTICNYVHDGDAPPDICPVCGADAKAFQKSADTVTGSDATPREWLCTVCKYVHTGDSPPDICPVCKKPWSAFIPNVEGPDGPRLPVAKSSATKKKSSVKTSRLRCVICNYIHEGSEAPNICPICGAGADAFVPEKDSPEHHHRGFSGLIEKLHLHPVSAHMPNGALPLAFLSWVAFLVLGEACLERTSFYLLLVAALAVPFTAISGWSDAKHRFGTTTTGIFPEKKRWSLVLTALMLGITGWRLALGWSHIPVGAEITAFSVLLLAATGVAARLGMLGGKLVFGH